MAQWNVCESHDSGMRVFAALYRKIALNPVEPG